jgi:hypothetical protein
MWESSLERVSARTPVRAVSQRETRTRAKRTPSTPVGRAKNLKRREAFFYAVPSMSCDLPRRATVRHCQQKRSNPEKWLATENFHAE